MHKEKRANGRVSVCSVLSANVASMNPAKRPKGYVQVERLPKSDYGKVLKTALREMLEKPEQGICGWSPGSRLLAFLTSSLIGAFSPKAQQARKERVTAPAY